MDKLNFSNKQNGDLLNASEWNSLASKVDEIVDEINTETGKTDSHIVFDTRDQSNPDGKSNLTIQTTAEDQYLDGDKTKGGKINLEPISDLQVKTGDDITLYSHHREDPEELSVKVLNGAEISATDQTEIEEYPVDLQLNLSNLVLTTKDKDITISEKNKAKQAEVTTYNTEHAQDQDFTPKVYSPTKDAKNVLNVEIKTGKKAKKATKSDGQYGYLKLRSQAIDLRCEDHGGIALQPKGYDNDGNMNKIKFEHGGGDGLEFGTFNTEHTSIFTGDYRFNKDGVIKLSTRFTEPSGKTDDTGIFDNNPIGKDPTNQLKYLKNDSTNNAALATQEGKTFDAADDFYDFVDSSDPTCTWEDIVKFIAWAKANAAGSAWENLWPQSVNL